MALWKFTNLINMEILEVGLYIDQMEKLLVLIHVVLVLLLMLECSDMNINMK